MFQNNAELRSLGGTALSFSEISVDDGEIQLTRTVRAGRAEFSFGEEPVVTLPAGFEDLYSRADCYFIADATMRPSGDTAAVLCRPSGGQVRRRGGRGSFHGRPGSEWTHGCHRARYAVHRR